MVRIGLLLMMLGFGIQTGAQEGEPYTLTVGLNQEPPFIMEQSDGEWKGVSIHLWEEVAEQLDRPYQYQAYDLQGGIGCFSYGFRGPGHYANDRYKRTPAKL